MHDPFECLIDREGSDPFKVQLKTVLANSFLRDCFRLRNEPGWCHDNSLRLFVRVEYGHQMTRIFVLGICDDSSTINLNAYVDTLFTRTKQAIRVINRKCFV